MYEFEEPSEQTVPPVMPPRVVADAMVLDQQREIALDEQGRIAENISCQQCSYNLRGLLPDEVCPECGLAIEKSTRQDLLQFAHPDLLGKLAKGTTLIVIGLLSNIVVSILSGIALQVIMVISATSTTSSGGNTTVTMPSAFNTTFGTVALSLFGLLAAGCLLVAAYGAWLLTSPDPSKFSEERKLNARVLARWCLIAMVLQAPLQFIQQGAGVSGFSSGGSIGVGPIFIVVIILAVIVGFVVTVGYIAGLLYLRNLAQRIPRNTLAKQSTIVAWGLGITSGIGALVGVAILFVMPSMMAIGAGATPTSGQLAYLITAGIGGCIGGLGSLVFGIWAIVLLFMFKSAFRNLHTAAVAEWNISQHATVSSSTLSK